MSWISGVCVSLLFVLLVHTSEARFRKVVDDGFSPAFDLDDNSSDESLQLQSRNPRHFGGGYRRPGGCWGWSYMNCWGHHRPPQPSRVDGGWSQWSYYGTCSKSCGAGLRPAVRYCNNPAPAHCGRYCPGSNRAMVYCNCKPCSVNGGWSNWRPSGVCSAIAGSSTPVACGQGYQKYVRTCTNPSPSAGGRGCPGESEKVEVCSSGSTCAGCKIDSIAPHAVYYSNGEVVTVGQSIANGASISATCSIGFEGQSTTLTCTNGQLEGNTPSCTDINECDNNEGGCDQSRSTCVNTEGSFQCKCKPGFTADPSGNCAGVPIHGNWGEWFPSGVCSASCGSGRQRFERKCDNPPPSNGGQPCLGEDFKLEPCNVKCCPVDGEWTDWTEGKCSKTCGNGVRVRQRYCKEPVCGGRDCVGPATEEVECVAEDCRGCPIPSAPPGVEWQLDPGLTEIPNRGSLQYICGDGFTTPGGEFGTITCNGGVWEGQAKCNDVDECKENLHDCNPATSVCLNEVGGFTCSCKEGYEKVGDTHDCQDIDECKDSSMNKCKQECTNNFGGYTCYCQPGYELKPDGVSCKSVKCGRIGEPANAKSPKCDSTTPAEKACTVTCFEGYIFPGNGRVKDFSCSNGIWDFDRLGEELPDCEKDESLELDFDLEIPTGEGCDPQAQYDGDLSGTDADAAVQCQASKKRSGIGRLICNIRKNMPLPPNCDKACASAEAKRIGYPWRDELYRKLTAGEVSLTYRNRGTGEKKTITLPRGPNSMHIKLGCPIGKIVSYGTDKTSCCKCSPGTYYDIIDKLCVACPLNTYNDQPGQNGPDSCRPCPEGKKTRRRGSKSEEDCGDLCPPGTYEPFGLTPCTPCEAGTYQPNSGSTRCKPCPFGAPSEPGSTALSDCQCSEGKYWQDCTKDCNCQNGGVCRIDGKCLCPRGWTGTDCSKTDPHPPCQDYYFVKFFKNYKGEKNNSILFVASNEDGYIDLRVGLDNTGEEQDGGTLKIDAETYQSQELPPDSPAVFQAAIYPEENIQIVSYSEQPQSTGIFAALPLQHLSPEDFEEYRVLSHSGKSPKYFSTVMVISAQDETEVEITPSQDCSMRQSSKSTVVKVKKGKTTSFTLFRYETVMVSGNKKKDLTGTKVRSSAPIACYSGHECGQYAKKNKKACDFFTEQLPPIRQWGHCYIVTPLLGNPADSLVKIIASQDGTQVNVHCVSLKNKPSITKEGIKLDDGEIYSFEMSQKDYCYIHSLTPIQVGQLTTNVEGKKWSGPGFSIIPKAGTGAKKIPFFCPEESKYNYFNLIAPSSEYDADNVFLDGKKISSFDVETTILTTSCGEYTLVRGTVERGYHRIESTQGESGFYLTVYGLDLNAAYAYSLGLNQAMACTNQKA